MEQVSTVSSDGKARCNADAGLIPWCGKGFSQSQLSVQNLTVSIQPPSVITCINACGHVNNPKYW